MVQLVQGSQNGSLVKLWILKHNSNLAILTSPLPVKNLLLLLKTGKLLPHFSCLLLPPPGMVIVTSARSSCQSPQPPFSTLGGIWNRSTARGDCPPLLLALYVNRGSSHNKSWMVTNARSRQLMEWSMRPIFWRTTILPDNILRGNPA